MKIFTPGTIARAADVNENFQELNSDLAKLKQNTGWVKVPLNPINGFSVYGDGLRYRLVGKICQLELPVYRSSGIPTNGLTAFEKLPEEIASLGPVTAVGNTDTDATIVGLISGTSISVSRKSGPAGAWVGLYFVYPVA